MTTQKEKTEVLVIDDERLIRLMISAKLKLIGYTAVCVASIPEAVVLLDDGGYKRFKAIITDIMMGDVDGFVFRDIVRGMDESMPIFFMTALDPEEGSGFLKRIMADSYSFYLPKSIKPDMLLKRVQSIVDSRRVEEFVREKEKENLESLTLASHLQRKMLPPRASITGTNFHTCWFKPKDIVSGDLLEIINLPDGSVLYVLGDIQGHGVSASLAMMAVQSFLKQLPTVDGFADLSPDAVANLMHHFFTDNLGSGSYMTALICIHHSKDRVVDWISCGAPDLRVVDPSKSAPEEINPEKRGNLPIGLVPDTVYSENDVVKTPLPKTALCVAFSDGVLDVYADQDCHEPMPEDLLIKLHHELLADTRMKYSMITFFYKFQLACEACGYGVFADDVTELIFGERLMEPNVLVKVIPMDAEVIDREAQAIEQWGDAQGWDHETATKASLVFEEKMMNLHDHGYDRRDLRGEQALFRLRKNGKFVELTVWDWGSQEPSIPVAAGNPELELELKNRDFSGRGRGRLILRKICCAIERSKYETLNETIYRIAAGGENKDERAS